MHINLKKQQLAAAVVLAVFGTAGASLVGGESFVARAALKPTECYKIALDDAPFTTDDVKTHYETWCYKELDKPAGARLVYNIDEQGRTKPELSIMVNADGTLTHASMLKGKLTVHRAFQTQGFNPLSAPLTPPADAERVAEPISPAAVDSVNEGIKLFDAANNGDNASADNGSAPGTGPTPGNDETTGNNGNNNVNTVIDPAKVEAGEFSASVPDEALPWRGYWWPYSSGKLHRGDESPLAKYDKFIARRAGGANIGSQKWEKWWHAPNFAWSGHCNGWAAASIMSPEPKKPITDPYSGVTFRVSDQKAYLTIQHYCPKIAFYGRRNYGKPENDPNDIYAGTFHNVITYFIGQMKKPVLFDLMASRPVQNSVASGYTMKIKRIGSNTFSVEAKVRIHKYDEQVIDEPAVAPSSIRTYRYTLRTDNQGRVVSGSWNSSNPDFIWVPIADGECPERNKAVDQFWIDEIHRVSK